MNTNGASWRNNIVLIRSGESKREWRREPGGLGGQQALVSQRKSAPPLLSLRTCEHPTQYWANTLERKSAAQPDDLSPLWNVDSIFMLLRQSRDSLKSRTRLVEAQAWTEPGNLEEGLLGLLTDFWNSIFFSLRLRSAQRSAGWAVVRFVNQDYFFSVQKVLFKSFSKWRRGIAAGTPAHFQPFVRERKSREKI